MTNVVDLAKKEQKEKARPSLAKTLDTIQNYELIFLGFPNWWGDMPMPVYTFVEQFDFTGKIIIPFCTHEGSGLGSIPQKNRAFLQGGDSSQRDCCTRQCRPKFSKDRAGYCQ